MCYINIFPACTACLKELKESIGAKRLHVPKLNASQIKDGWQSDSDGDSV